MGCDDRSAAILGARHASAICLRGDGKSGVGSGVREITRTAQVMMTLSRGDALNFPLSERPPV